ncbi:NAD(P)H-dependent oxidoreductase [Sneathiella litorea]|uniref:Flavodoxin family protein n=1 Tax=Sneathiella litorea TaxID=2606216 RepID=A0A6L8W9V6_9PROT|nr:NAD(P)H-dependent oxidoreductase [Sneathiella litorea]MZR31489.1 flavodoxin family protein [Sneathiella litorea]
MSKTVTIILGHPAKASYCRAIAESYRDGAASAGHKVHFLPLSDMKFDPILHEGYHKEQILEPDLQHAQEAIIASDHIVIIYPLWIGMMPALLKGFFERTFQRGFAYKEAKNPFEVGLLKGRSARVIITMGMPGWFFRWFYCAHSAMALKRNLLHFCGIKPVRFTYLGMVEAASENERRKWLESIRKLGRKAY